MKLKLLEQNDAEQACALAHSVGWLHHDLKSLQRTIAWSKGLGFGLEQHGTLVSIGFAIPYQTQRARITMVITHPEYQGQGLASRILRHLLDVLAEFDTVDLDFFDKRTSGLPEARIPASHANSDMGAPTK